MTGFFHRKRNIAFLITFLVCACFLAWFINAYTPDSMWTHGVFYLIMGGGLFSLFMFIFADRRVSAIVAIGTVLYFFIRFLHLRHPLYLLLLVVCCYSVYHVSSPRKPPTHL